MSIEAIHKQAILKLINAFTTSVKKEAVSGGDHQSSQQQQLTTPSQHGEDSCSSQPTDHLAALFKEPQTQIDLSMLTRLGYIISKFEQYFRPNSLIINGTMTNSNNNNNGHNNNKINQSSNLIYLQQITVLIEYIEQNDLLKMKMENTIETMLQQQSSQHVQMLILLIRDWMMQFYLDKNFIYELFPSSATNEGTTFSLVNLKENNIFLISLLIFNIYFKLRNSFSEYNLLLEFSWMCFEDLEPYIALANLDLEYIFNMLQSSLLSARIEDDQESQINSSLYKQIEVFRNNIVESKKRLFSLDISNKQSLPNSSNAKSSSNNVKSEMHQQPLSLHHHSHPHHNNQNHNQIGKNVALSGAHRQQQSTYPKMAFSSSSVTGHDGGGESHHHHHHSSKSSGSNELKRESKRSGTNNNLDGNCSPSAGIERPYKCDVCLKSFPTSYKLNRHSYSHSGERPYMCTWPNCHKRFNDNYHLRRHTNTHTGEKPFPCKYPGCPKRYSRSEDLRNHQKTHFGGDGGGGGSSRSSSAASNHHHQQQQQLHSPMGINLSQNPNNSSHHTRNNNNNSNSNNGQNLVMMQQNIPHPQSPANQQQPSSSSTSSSVTSNIKSPSSHHHSHQQQQHPHSHHHHQQQRMANSQQSTGANNNNSGALLQSQLSQLQHLHQQAFSSALRQEDSSALHQQQQTSQQSASTTTIILQQDVSTTNNNGTNQQQQNAANASAAAAAAVNMQHLTENYF